jgi:hypothetical protein
MACNLPNFAVLLDFYLTESLQKWRILIEDGLHVIISGWSCSWIRNIPELNPLSSNSDNSGNPEYFWTCVSLSSLVLDRRDIRMSVIWFIALKLRYVMNAPITTRPIILTSLKQVRPRFAHISRYRFLLRKWQNPVLTSCPRIHLFTKGWLEHNRDRVPLHLDAFQYRDREPCQRLVTILEGPMGYEAST